MDFLRGKHRLGLYLLLLAMLAVGALAAVWSVAGTGAYLTGEADWQSLAGDYRIGTIDYTVRINDELLLGRSASGDVLTKYRLAAPLLGGVKMFDTDPNLTDATVRAREFNEGATLIRVRVANYSKNMVDVTAQFRLYSQTAAGVPPIRALALPVTLNETTAPTFDCRKYILDTLGKPTDLGALETAYTTYLAGSENQLVLEMGLLPGSVTGSKPEGDVKAQEEIDKIADTTEKAAAQKALDQAIAIRKALRVAFVPVGGTPVILQFDSGNSDITGNNTFYNGKTDANASHNETTGNYIGIAAVDANKHVDSVGSLKATVLAAADKAHLATVTADGTVTAPADVTAKELFTVTAGDTGLAVNVYFWLEGTDADCLNALSGYGFNLRLPFAAVPVTPATP